MSWSSRKYRFDAVERLTLDGRNYRQNSSSEEGILLQSDDDGPRVDLALTWKDVGDHVCSLRLVVHKNYHQLAKDGVLSTFTSDQVAHFRHYASLVFSALRPTVRQVYLQMKHDHRWRMDNGQPALELCSERTFHRLVDQMRRSAPMAMSAPLTGAHSN
ncbi:hypothetical protein [Rhizobium sp. Rhizsp42]|uniref:hypothetical protein n=1 Tax=Rhizobium sp. Rhizsp42 TaxID=3243034 RepID=UPI0039AE95D7